MIELGASPSAFTGRGAVYQALRVEVNGVLARPSSKVNRVLDTFRLAGTPTFCAGEPFALVLRDLSESSSLTYNHAARLALRGIYFPLEGWELAGPGSSYLNSQFTYDPSTQYEVPASLCKGSDF